ncbi:DUF3289 family protein [uncultured Aquimarina sp.]|uniref:DUF3289 family protein n=1 Tax=uncultured Aquimarina sp. TaxID=575652 RepID=UPI002630E2F0|nr:DUF3289 family protein [uncultured Aquimarina sp.]
MSGQFVKNGATLSCPLCSSDGVLIVSHTEVQLQDTPCATNGDKSKTNLVFGGVCKKWRKSPPPCASVIAPTQWKGVATNLEIDGEFMLLEDSTITCSTGGVDIAIEDTAQTDVPTDLPESMLQDVEVPFYVERYRIPGLNEDGNAIANDMAYGFGEPSTLIYSEEEIQTYSQQYEQAGFNNADHIKFANGDRITDKAIYKTEEITELRPILFNLTRLNFDFMLFDDFRIMAYQLSSGALRENIASMIDKFQNNEGGIYENNDLNQAAIESSATKRFCEALENDITQRIQNRGGNISAAEDTSIRWQRRQGASPSFARGEDNNLFRGLTIAVNDIWSYEVSIIEYTRKGNGYDIKYEVIYWDHFGLDLPDMQKFYSLGAGFRGWFFLQHVRGYKPFLTKITFEKEFFVPTS